MTTLSDEKLSEIRGWWEEWEDFEFEHVAQMFAPATQALQDVPALLDEVDRLRARVVRLEGVLREVEWAARDADDDGKPIETCPACRWWKTQGHHPQCDLDAALRGKEITNDNATE